ncbi:tetratricopeptide repeat protein [Tenacibaculum amylolyticum]|uniref:tetratricopeptide repeat protein n=1 Tax=Tenacibaculum amylolyticum TaxID=104269 RepID=UPI003895B8A2
MIKKLTLLFFLCFQLYVVFPQDRDTLFVQYEKDYKTTKTDTARLQSIIKLGTYLITRDFKQAEQYFNEGIAIIENSETDLENYNAEINVHLGVINRRKASYDKALAYYLKALKYFEKVKDTSKIGDVYHNMGLVFRYQRLHKKAITNYKKAIALKKKVKDTFGIGAGYNMLGVSYRQNNQLDSALISYEKAEYLFRAINNKEAVHGVYGNLGALYGFQRKFDISLPLKFKNLAYYKSIGKQLSICVEYFNISNDYKRMKNYELSYVYADSSLQVALKQDFKERISKAYLRKSFLSGKLGNYKNAYNFYRKFNRYSDSIFNIENAKKLQELELQYKFDKEKSALELQNKAEASKKQLYLVLLILASISIILIGFLLRSNYLQKIRLTQMEFEQEQEKLNKTLLTKENEIKQLIADNTMRLKFKEELIQSIKKELVQEESIQTKNKLNSLITQLQLQITTEKRRDGLQQKINEINENFDTTLKEKFPELTKGEREVCALLRLDLSIKEIMVVRNVTIDSVKSMRRRIRKKMNIPVEFTIEDYIKKLD